MNKVPTEAEFLEEMCRRSLEGDNGALNLLREKAKRVVLAMPCDALVGLVRANLKPSRLDLLAAIAEGDDDE